MPCRTQEPVWRGSWNEKRRGLLTKDLNGPPSEHDAAGISTVCFFIMELNLNMMGLIILLRHGIDVYYPIRSNVNVINTILLKEERQIY